MLASQIVILDFLQTGVKTGTMLHTIYRICTEALDKIKDVLKSYKKLFCYDAKRKASTLDEKGEDPKTTRFYMYAHSLIDLCIPLIIEISTKQQYDANFIKEIISKMIIEKTEFEQIIGLPANISEKFDKIIEEIILGHYKQKSRQLKEKIENVVIKLGDECACLDVSAFYSVLEKKYSEFMKILSNFIQDEIVFFTKIGINRHYYELMMKK